MKKSWRDGLIVEIENAADLADKQKTDPKEFAMIRRNGFGASDSSVLLNVNPFKGLQDLLREKCSTEVTKEEIAIGKKPNVRKGAELENFILEKFIKWAKIVVEKPSEMFRMEAYPPLTVNFDGIIFDPDSQFNGMPVEIKMVSMNAEKYWNKDPAIGSSSYSDDGSLRTWELEDKPLASWSEEYCKMRSAECGIPIYYYTQCQQQILAAGSEGCFLAALHDKDWTLRVYYVPRDPITIARLILQAHTSWSQVEKRKGTS